MAVAANFTYQGDEVLQGRAARAFEGVPGGRRDGRGAHPEGVRRTYPEGDHQGDHRLRKRPVMRVYVPLTLPGLAAAHKAGELGPGPLTAYAVTPGMREWYVSDDIEELEYAALSRAAAASLRLMAGDPDAVRRRVVVAVDVPDQAAVADPDRVLDAGALGEVRIAAAVPMSEAAAVHVDADDAVDDVSAAVAALGAADHGDDDAQFTVDGAEDHELLWFGVQEIPNIVG